MSSQSLVEMDSITSNDSIPTVASSSFASETSTIDADQEDDDGISIIPQEGTIAHGGARGPTRSHTIWDYCTARKDSKGKPYVQCNYCAKTYASLNTTGPKGHLQRKHPSKWSEMEKKQKSMEKKKNITVEQQSSIEKHLSTPRKSKMERTVREYSKLISQSSVSYRAATSPAFRKFMKKANPEWPCPSVNTIIKDMKCFADEARQEIKIILSKAGKLTIELDEWTSSGMKHSYLGIQAHFFNKRTHKREHCLIACRVMECRATGENIRTLTYAVLDEYGVKHENVFRVITDNGSPMVKGFEGNTVERAALRMEVREALPGFELEASDSDDSEGEHEEIADRMEEAFPGRLSCFIHTLMCCGRAVFDKDEVVLSVKEPLMKILNAIRHSHVATKDLMDMQARSGTAKPLSILTPATTRWNSLYQVLERVCVLKEHLAALIAKNNWQHPPGMWQTIELLRDIMGPIAKHTMDCQTDKATTISLVYPCVLNLIKHFDEFNDEDFIIGLLPSKMLIELRRRFAKWTDHTRFDVDPTFLIAAYFDPIYAKFYMSPEERKFASDQIKRIARAEAVPESEESVNPEDVQSTSQMDTSQMTKTNALAMYSKMYSYLVPTTTLPSTSTSSSGPCAFSLDDVLRKREKEIDVYNNMVSSKDDLSTHYDMMDCISFWIENEMFQNWLAKFATAVLCVPASTAGVERVFSTAGLRTQGRRHVIGPKTLECEMIIDKNRHILA